MLRYNMLVEGKKLDSIQAEFRFSNLDLDGVFSSADELVFDCYDHPIDVGMRVRVKRDLVVSMNYDGIRFERHMKRYRGKVFTVIGRGWGGAIHVKLPDLPDEPSNRRRNRNRNRRNSTMSFTDSMLEVV
jgi:hypothetical protein